MKKIIPSFILLTFSILVFFVSDINTAGKQFGKISLPLGKVEVQATGVEAWEKAKPNRPVFEGDVIRTAPKSRAEITLQGGGKMRIGENSELELTAANVKPMAKNFSANLKKGNIFVSAKAVFGEKKSVSVRTPTAVAAIRGTKYRAKAGDDERSLDGNLAVLRVGCPSPLGVETSLQCPDDHAFDDRNSQRG